MCVHVLEVGEDTTSAIKQSSAFDTSNINYFIVKAGFYSLCTDTIDVSLCVCVCRIAEYIPPRPALPRKVGGAERAVANYHSQTANIANTLLEEYR